MGFAASFCIVFVGVTGVAMRRYASSSVEAAQLDSSTDVAGPTDDLVLREYKGLTCSESDDDYWGWGVETCVSGDTKTCAEYSHPANIWSVCKQSCNMSAMKSLYEDVQDGNSYNNDVAVSGSSSWWVVCEWEAIKSLPDFCAGTFTPTYPWELTAKDIGETNDEQTSVYIHGEKWDSCNVHAFCLVGVDTQGSVNPYMKAVIEHYNSSTPSDAKTGAFDYLSSWCQPGTLESIQNGTFDATQPLPSVSKTDFWFSQLSDDQGYNPSDLGNWSR